MSVTIKKYKPFLVFLARFFLSYMIFAGLYQLFVSRYDASAFEVDPITTAVADQSAWLLRSFGADAETAVHPTQACVKLIYEGLFVARIIEGCNAVSVMVLFAAFVIAFAGKLRHTILFIIGGCVGIYLLNIARIAFLASAIFHYPQHEPFLHGVVFPLIIYSAVFILWVIWVNKFSYVKNPARK